MPKTKTKKKKKKLGLMGLDIPFGELNLRDLGLGRDLSKLKRQSPSSTVGKAGKEMETRRRKKKKEY